MSVRKRSSSARAEAHALGGRVLVCPASLDWALRISPLPSISWLVFGSSLPIVFRPGWHENVLKLFLFCDEFMDECLLWFR